MPIFRFFAVCLIATLPAVAQFSSRSAPGVAFGHIHLNSSDPDAAIAFWKDVIGAATYSHESLNGVSTLGTTILFSKKDPSGPSAGSTIEYIALKVPDLQPFVEKLAKTHYKSFHPVPGGDSLMIDGPDGVRMELTEDSSMYAPLQCDHIEFLTPRLWMRRRGT